MGRLPTNHFSVWFYFRLKLLYFYENRVSADDPISAVYKLLAPSQAFRNLFYVVLYTVRPKFEYPVDSLLLSPLILNISSITNNNYTTM